VNEEIVEIEVEIEVTEQIEETDQKEIEETEQIEETEEIEEEVIEEVHQIEDLHLQEEDLVVVLEDVLIVEEMDIGPVIVQMKTEGIVVSIVEEVVIWQENAEREEEEDSIHTRDLVLVQDQDRNHQREGHRNHPIDVLDPQKEDPSLHPQQERDLNHPTNPFLQGKHHDHPLQRKEDLDLLLQQRGLFLQQENDVLHPKDDMILDWFIFSEALFLLSCGKLEYHGIKLLLSYWLAFLWLACVV